jgi:hypothetical protein
VSLLEGNSIYRKNIELFKEKYPQSWNNIKDKQDTKFVPIITKAKDGNATISVVSKNNEICIHSRYKPLDEAHKRVQNLKIKDKKMIIVFGFGAGYHIREFLANKQKETYIIVVEPSASIFKKVMECIDISDILSNDKVILLVSNDEIDQKNIFRHFINWSCVGKMIVESLPAYRKMFLEEYVAFLKIIKDVCDDCIVTRNTTIAFSESWQTNLLKNMRYLFESALVKSLFDKFIDKPAIIVSAGPSLNKNVDLLKNIKDTALIICVDTALKVLLRKGIKPHLVISVDGSLLNYDKYKGMDYADIPLVYTPKVHNEILKNHGGKKILYYTGDFYVEYLFSKFNIDAGSLDSGGSVANNAFDLAVKMGANPIIFIGQDLAYTDNKTHAEGTMYDGKNELKNDAANENIVVEDIYGRKIKTNFSFNMFRKWFEAKIKEDRSNRLYINATEGGANIKGTTVMNLKDALERYCNQAFDIEDIIQGIFDKKVFTTEHMQSIINAFKMVEKDLKTIKDKSTTAYALSDELYGMYEDKCYNEIRIRDIIKTLDNIDNRIKEKRDKAALVNYMLTPMFYNVMTLTSVVGDETNEVEKGVRVAGMSRILYDGIIKAIDYTQPLLRECIEELEDYINQK